MSLIDKNGTDRGHLWRASQVALLFFNTWKKKVLNMFVPLLSICLLELLFSSSIVVANEDQSISVPLPTHIEPVSYKIKLVIHLENFVQFRGHTTIQIRVKDKTNKIILHTKNLYIHSVDLFTKTLKSIEIDKFTIDKGNEFLIIELKESLPTGTYELSFRYENSDNGEELLGLIHRSYKNSENQKSWMVFTKMEQTGARAVFPCWDDPRIKAKFTIIVEHDSKYGVLSNMPSVYKHYSGTNYDKATTYFSESPKMSTYLIAIVICDFASRESKNGLIRLHARHDIIDQMSYLLESAEKVIKFMDNYTGISYKSFGFKKLDIVMVPYIGDFIAGLENWGLIILQEMEYYRDNNVLADTSGKEGMTGLIAHECTHQWFGSLITTRSWADLWIIDGISTYLQYFIVDQIESSWHILDRFIINHEIQIAMKKRIMLQPRTPDNKFKVISDIVRIDSRQIDFRFANVIRMVAQIVGDEKIQQVSKNLLENHGYETITAESIIDQFARAADIGIEIFREIIYNWVDALGFPVLDVRRNYATREVTVRQQRYSSPSNVSEYWGERYWIPINYVTEDHMNFDDIGNITWMRPNDTTLEFTGFQSHKWVIFNKQRFGYYIVNYDERNWELIIETLKSDNFSKIHLRNRLQLTQDAFLLLRAGRIRHKLVLALMSYLERETDIIPWIPIWEGVEFMKNYLRNSKYLKPFKRYIAHLVHGSIIDTGFDDLPGDSHLLKYYRADILALACYSGLESCQRAALTKLIRWMNNSTQTQFLPNMEKTIFCYGLRNASDTVWDHLWQKWLNNSNHDLLRALGCTSNPKLLKKLLSLVTAHDRKFAYYNLPAAIKAVASGSENGVDVAIDFLSEHWASTNNTDSFYWPEIRNFIFLICEQIDEMNQYNMLQDFVEQHRSDLIRSGVDVEALKKEIMRRLERTKTMIPDYEIFFFPGGKFS